ncbi:Probable RING finger protein 207 homolog [Trichuris trichiura]|uniref:Probable RING finger protein 207 homolog n=1 Tax=Trichuris trichiura TaxID=36087 RepID=A0A077ZDK8_TRITR|nr:Probable RING finger protein 207 homolog [Trichuris trichiura]
MMRPMVVYKCTADTYESHTDEGCSKVCELVNLLIDSCLRSGDVCANCDQHSDAIYFCETCRQLLCTSCKFLTHQPKVFHSHRIVPATNNHVARSKLKICERHNKDCTLFSVGTGSFACVECVSNNSNQSSHSFIDFDTAYTKSSRLLTETVQVCHQEHFILIELTCPCQPSYSRLKNYQMGLTEEISEFQRLHEEACKAKTSEVDSVATLYQQLLDSLKDARDKLLTAINGKYARTEAEMEQSVKTLHALHNSAQLNQMLADFVLSWAEKREFLDYAFDLNSFINTALAKHPLVKPTMVAHPQVNASAEFAKSLESAGLVCSSSGKQQPQSFVLPLDFQRNKCSSRGSCSSNCSFTSGYQSLSSSSSLQSHSYGCSGDLLRRDVTSTFCEHFAAIHAELLECRKHFSSIVQEALELQRDVTLRKCLTDSQKLYNVRQLGQKLKIILGAHSSRVDELQPVFQQIWEEELDRVRLQQESYKNHVNTVASLRQDLQQLITASERMVPFVDSISQAIRQIDPMRSHQDLPGPMEQLCLQIATLEPNSQVRVDAIEKQEQQRRIDMEKRRHEACNVLADVKRLLKSTRDSSKLRHGGDGNGIVLSVQRDRMDQKPSPSYHRDPKGTASWMSKAGVKSETLKFFPPCRDEKAGLEANLEMILNQESLYPIGKSKMESDGVDRSESVNCVANFDLCVQKKDVSALVHELLCKQTIILPCSLSISNIDRPTESNLLVRDSAQYDPNKLADADYDGGGKDLTAAVIYAKIPPNFLSEVRPSTLQAREKMLASLKSKLSQKGSAIDLKSNAVVGTAGSHTYCRCHFALLSSSLLVKNIWENVSREMFAKLVLIGRQCEIEFLDRSGLIGKLHALDQKPQQAAWVQMDPYIVALYFLLDIR